MKDCSLIDMYRHFRSDTGCNIRYEVTKDATPTYPFEVSDANSNTSFTD